MAASTVNTYQTPSGVNGGSSTTQIDTGNAAGSYTGGTTTAANASSGSTKFTETPQYNPNQQELTTFKEGTQTQSGLLKMGDYDASKSTYNPTTLGSSAYSGYNASQQSVDNNQLVSGRLNALTNQNSPYMQQATTAGYQQAATRGLLNSSMAVGAAQNEAYKWATPIAQAEAARYGEVSNLNQQATNQQLAYNSDLQFKAGQSGVDALNRAGEFNAGTSLEKWKQNDLQQFEAWSQDDQQAFAATMQDDAQNFNQWSQQEQQAYGAWLQKDAQNYSRWAQDDQQAFQQTLATNENELKKWLQKDMQGFEQWKLKDQQSFERTILGDQQNFQMAQAYREHTYAKALQDDAQNFSQWAQEDQQAFQQTLATNENELKKWLQKDMQGFEQWRQDDQQGFLASMQSDQQTFQQVLATLQQKFAVQNQDDQQQWLAGESALERQSKAAQFTTGLEYEQGWREMADATTRYGSDNSLRSQAMQLDYGMAKGSLDNLANIFAKGVGDSKTATAAANSLQSVIRAMGIDKASFMAMIGG